MKSVKVECFEKVKYEKKREAFKIKTNAYILTELN